MCHVVTSVIELCGNRLGGPFHSRARTGILTGSEGFYSAERESASCYRKVVDLRRGTCCLLEGLLVDTCDMTASVFVAI